MRQQHTHQTRAWVGQSGRAHLHAPRADLGFSPFWKVIRARLRGRDPSTGWAGPCAVQHTPSGVGHVWRAQRAAREIQIAQPLRTRSSHDLHTWVRPNQLVLSITVICTGCARMRWSKRAITFEVCSTSFKRGVCTCSESAYSMSPIPGAPPATNQLVSPLSWAGASYF